MNAKRFFMFISSFLIELKYYIGYTFGLFPGFIHEIYRAASFFSNLPI